MIRVHLEDGKRLYGKEMLTNRTDNFHNCFGHSIRKNKSNLEKKMKQDI